MNQTLEKFIRKLKTEVNKTLKSLSYDGTIVFDGTEGKIDVTVDIAVNQIVKMAEIIRNGGDVEQEWEDIYIKFFTTNKPYVDKIEEIYFISKSLKDVFYFDKFDIVKIYLDKFKFNEIEQAEVLAAYLNIVINFINDGEVFEEENIRNHILKKLDGLVKKYPKKKLQKLVNSKIDDIKKALEKDREYCVLLRNVVAPDGSLLANEVATELKWVFSSFKTEMTEELIDILLNGSEKKHELIKKEKEQAEQEVVNKAKKLEEIKNKQKNEEAKREEARKNRKLALQELKKYLKNDTPITYIEEAEVLKVIGLLKTARYPDEQIKIIVKNINNNNLRLGEEYIAHMNEEQEAKYIKFFQEHLTKEEQDIITEGTNITTAENSLKNEIYGNIAGNLAEIRSIIINLDNNDEETIEYLKLYIEELKNNIEAYKMSDYRYLSDIQYKMRTKKEDEQNV